ncbi:response regulator [Cohnella sp. REN36]|uniref:response regulator n=1 Tax=Cohnella sp. REN36 TaxID=2887347 RepID=UPI001D144488|nr:response regulator [Cohnella sp. REN36]MCC3371487.1 response regulator [Cohnella sp. REN36]
MFSLMVVEDERWIRRGICETIDWTTEGIRLTGEASDGEEAMRLMERQSPDIVLTDIVMPGMDGITFLKCMRDRQVDAKVIIMSGYSDFEYARNALKNGAFDYVLKPIHENNLLDVVRRCVQELKRQRQTESELRDLVRSARETLLLARQRFFETMLLMKERHAPGWAEEQMKTLRIDLDPNRIRAFAVKIADWGRKAETGRDRALLVYALCNMLGEIGRRYGPSVAFPLHRQTTDGEAELALLHTERASRDRREPAIAADLPSLIELAGQMLGVRVSVGYAGEGSLARLPGMFEEAMHAAAFWFYDGGGSVWDAGRLAAAIRADAPYCGPADWDRRFVAELNIGDFERIERLVGELAEHLRSHQNRCLPLTIRRGLKLLFQNVNQTIEALHRRGRPSDDAEPSVQLDLPNVPMETIPEALLEAVSRALRRDRPAHGRKWLVARALQYLESRQDQSVSLSEVAAHLYVNPSYFSKLFHEDMGETFSRYVLRARIEAAKKLLKETPLKIYEIAGQVGYQDIRHFTKVFKEIEGLTPIQYREYGL